MKPIYKTILTVFLILSLVGTVVEAGPGKLIRPEIPEPNQGTLKQPIPDNTAEMAAVAGEPYMVQVCCLMNTMDIYSTINRNRYKLPLTVDVWDNYLNPVSGATITVKIYRYNTDRTRTLLYSNIKTTDSSGKKKFGSSIPLNEGDTKIYIHIEAKKNYVSEFFDQDVTIRRSLFGLPNT